MCHIDAFFWHVWSCYFNIFCNVTLTYFNIILTYCYVILILTYFLCYFNILCDPLWENIPFRAKVEKKRYKQKSRKKSFFNPKLFLAYLKFQLLGYLLAKFQHLNRYSFAKRAAQRELLLFSSRGRLYMNDIWETRFVYKHVTILTASDFSTTTQTLNFSVDFSEVVFFTFRITACIWNVYLHRMDEVYISF